MKKYKLILGTLMITMALSLNACQGTDGWVSASGSANSFEKTWKDAMDEGSIRDYIKIHYDKLDMEKLAEAAGDDTLPLNQQFKATVLLCELEYQQYMNEHEHSILTYREDGVQIGGYAYRTDEYLEIGKGNDVFAAEYSVSSPYAERLLAKVSDDDSFWEALEEAPYPYNYFMNLFAAVTTIDGETLADLTMYVPEEYKSQAEPITEAVDKWLTKHPDQLPVVGDSLINAGFFERMDYSMLSLTFFEGDHTPIQTEDINAGLAFISFMKDKMIPWYEKIYADNGVVTADSELLGAPVYQIKKNIVVPDTLDLKEEVSETPVETVDLEGKKVIAFYHNTQFDSNPYSPAPLRIIGDFMLTLPEEQLAKTVEEADYYLVLTPNYLLGDFYTMNSGTQQIQQVFSYTAIDLYDAKSGMLIRNLGTVREEPTSTLFYTSSETRPDLEYPVTTSADILLFMYQNVNTPEAYQHLTEAYSGGRTDLKARESVQIGSWELLLESYDITNSFTESIFAYDAEAGATFLRAYYTITNHSNENQTLFPIIYYENKDLSAVLKDNSGNRYQPAGISSSQYFSGTGFEAGETKSAYILFQIPLSITESGQPLSIEWQIKPQSVTYILE